MTSLLAEYLTLSFYNVPGMMSIMHTLELYSHYVLEFIILVAAIVRRNVFRVCWTIVSEKIELSV